ncbi:UNVERIFIED_CONTAM: hypothetical protein GTU68_010768 [Idotea baltica]|nr:hypothetical protein [Idotea baltica]
MKKVLVTGGAGYIGSHAIVELVKAGYEPILLDNYSNSERNVPAQIEKILGRSIQCLRGLFTQEEGITGVLHFAAFKAVGESVADPLKYYHNNIGAMTALLQVMAEFGVGDFVFSSSCTVYGSPDSNPVTESSPIKPATSPYGFTKQFGEQIIHDMVASSKAFRAAVLRYFNPIGAHPTSLIGELPLGPPNNLVPYTTQTAIGIREQLTVFGGDYDTPDGTCIRDYIHVVDLAKAHVKALAYLNRQTASDFIMPVNIGTGHGHSVLEVVNSFQEVTGQKLNYKIGVRRAGDVEQVWAASGGNVELLGWKAELSLSDALRDAWNWEKALRKRGQ